MALLQNWLYHHLATLTTTNQNYIQEMTATSQDNDRTFSTNHDARNIPVIKGTGQKRVISSNPYNDTEAFITLIDIGLSK